jgi:hypothetical protein
MPLQVSLRVELKRRHSDPGGLVARVANLRGWASILVGSRSAAAVQHHFSSLVIFENVTNAAKAIIFEQRLHVRKAQVNRTGCRSSWLCANP